MNRIPLIIACIACSLHTNGAKAEGRINDLCGAGHQNEIAAHDDVTENPDGFFIRSLGIQLSHGDPRIVRAVGKTFHLCTRSAATPDMDSTRALQMMQERTVRALFVPTPCPRQPGA